MLFKAPEISRMRFSTRVARAEASWRAKMARLAAPRAPTWVVVETMAALMLANAALMVSVAVLLSAAVESAVRPAVVELMMAVWAWTWVKSDVTRSVGSARFWTGAGTAKAATMRERKEKRVKNVDFILTGVFVLWNFLKCEKGERLVEGLEEAGSAGVEFFELMG